MFLLDELAKQLSLVDAKLIFSLVDNCPVMLKACSINTCSLPVVAMKSNQQQTIPDGIIDLKDIIDTSGKNN